MLSGSEQRMLDGIERTLRDGDPEFAANISFDHLRRRRRLREMAAGITFVLGLSLMMIGVDVRPLPPAVSAIVDTRRPVTASGQTDFVVGIKFEGGWPANGNAGVGHSRRRNRPR